MPMPKATVPDDHPRLVSYEVILVGSPCFPGQPGVICHSSYAVLDEVGRERLRTLLGASIHDGASVGPVAEHTYERVVAVAAGQYVVPQVGSIEARHEPFRVTQLQLSLDVFPHLRRSRGGERDERRIFAQPPEYSQVAVVGSELVTPLRDAVSLVHGYQADFQRVQILLESRLYDALRRHVQEFQIAVKRGLLDSELLLPRLRAVQEVGRNAVALESVHLVLHKRDQGRDHQGDSGKSERRKLVAQRFAATGGHEYDGVTSVRHSVDDLCLKRAEVVVAEVSLEQVPHQVIIDDAFGMRACVS